MSSLIVLSNDSTRPPVDFSKSEVGKFAPMVVQIHYGCKEGKVIGGGLLVNEAVITTYHLLSRVAEIKQALPISIQYQDGTVVPATTVVRDRERHLSCIIPQYARQTDEPLLFTKAVAGNTLLVFRHSDRSLIAKKVSYTFRGGLVEPAKISYSNLSKMGSPVFSFSGHFVGLTYSVDVNRTKTFVLPASTIVDFIAQLRKRFGS